MSEMLTFQVALKQLEVQLVFPEVGVKNCLLKEMLGTGRDQFLTQLQKYTKFDVKGRPLGLSSFEGHQAWLLTRTFWDCEQNRFFTEEEIQALPSSILSVLYKKAQEMNGLDEEAAEKAKKESVESEKDG